MSATEQGLRLGQQNFAAATATVGTPKTQQKGNRDQETISSPPSEIREESPGPGRTGRQDRTGEGVVMLEDRSGDSGATRTGQQGNIRTGQRLPGNELNSTCESPRNRSLNPTRFLCRSEVRNFLLEWARKNRAHKFDRVSEETLVAINEFVRGKLIEHVRRLPSKGKTI